MENERPTVRRKKRKPRRKKRYMLRILVVLLISLSVYIGLHMVDYFDINGIAVIGNKDVLDEEVVVLSKINLGDNLFDVHPVFVERRIKKNLYIEDVNVNRKLPNKIEIIVKERQGKAQLQYKNKFVVTDNEGMVLDISKEMKKVTMLDNIEVADARLKKQVKVKEEKNLDRSMDLVMRADDNDLYFKSISIEGGKVSACVYGELFCRGRYNDMVQVIESGALKAVIFDLYQKGTDKGQINIGSNNYCAFTPAK